MRFIVLDTADGRGSVALLDENQVERIEFHSNDEDYSSWLLPAVRRAFNSSGLSLSELDGYAVCAGPGSFTGLRVGLTTVKAWSEIYNKPIAAISRLEALTANSPTESEIHESFVAACIDARRSQFFAALYQKTAKGFKLLGAESVAPPAEFIRVVAKQTAGHRVRWRTPDPELLQAVPEWHELAGAGHLLEPVHPPFADRLGWVAYRKFSAGDVTDAFSLDANYVRRSDAELFWKDNRFAVKA